MVGVDVRLGVLSYLVDPLFKLTHKRLIKASAF